MEKLPKKTKAPSEKQTNKQINKKQQREKIKIKIAGEK